MATWTGDAWNARGGTAPASECGGSGRAGVRVAGLSNKGILPVLWKLYPRHPNLLEASFDGPGLMMSWVRKPLLGREGANITLHEVGRHLETGGSSGAEGFVYQQMAALKTFDGQYPVLGSWVIGHEEGNVAGGIGIRESATPILTNGSPFVPHLFD